MRTVQGAKLRVEVGFTAKFTPSGGGSDGGFWVGDDRRWGGKM